MRKLSFLGFAEVVQDVAGHDCRITTAWAIYSQLQPPEIFISQGSYYR